MLGVVLALAATAAQPLAIRAEVAPLGSGPAGTVVGVALQVAPEDRARAGDRVRVTVTLLRDGNVLDRGGGVVPLSPDGSAMLYREWPTGEGEVRVFVENVDGTSSGVWTGKVVVPKLTERFEPGPDAPADALALAVRQPPARGGVTFKTPSQTGGIGAMQLEVEVPEATARVAFFQDDKELFVRNRPPWTVSVSLGEVARRTMVRAVAYDADGAVLGEDAFVLNAPANQIPVDILVRSEGKERAGAKVITVAVSGSKSPVDIRVSSGDTVIAQWTSCPCEYHMPAEAWKAATVLTAEAVAADGTHGDAVYLVGQGGFVEQVRVDKVELPLVVLDADGHPVSDLPRDAFKVWEDNIGVAVEGFGTTADLPLALGLAVDESGSMEERWSDVKEAIRGFTDQLLRSGDESFLMSFAWDAKVEQEWTRDKRGITSTLDRLHPEGGTSLHDAVVNALELFRGRSGRQALVLLTDGEDTTSRTGWDVALRYARTARVPVFPIGLRIGTLDFSLRGRLRDLAESTGGEAFFPSGPAELTAAYGKISEQLRSQYLLTYVSPSEEGPDHFRTVRVEVLRPNLKARTIAGYYPAQ
jgi:Ca-activated chloride channel family protein